MAALRLLVFALLIALGLSALLPSRTRATSALCATTPCVTTYAYGNDRNNVNNNETIFSASGTSWGSLAVKVSQDLLGIVYAQPLYVSQVPINGSNVNALYVATEANRLYALDGAALTAVWGPVDLDQSNEAPVDDSYLYPGNLCNNIFPEVGITGTPVIDVSPASTQPNVLYVVSKHYSTVDGVIRQRLNAIDITTGNAVATALDITTAYSNAGLPTFDAAIQNQRAGLALTHDGNGHPLVYVTWGSHCDNGAYLGKLAVFTMSGAPPTLSLLAAWDTSGGQSGATQGGIWMGGGAPAIDDAASGDSGNIFLASGNGSVSYGTSGLASSELGISVLQMQFAEGATDTLVPVGAFTPAEYNILNSGSGGLTGPCEYPLMLPAPYPSGSKYCAMGDMDLASGGVTLARPTANVIPDDSDMAVLAAGKEGVVYVLDPSNMANTQPDQTVPCSEGTASSDQTLQCFGAIALPNLNTNTQQKDDTGSRCALTFWPGNSTYKQNVLYVGGSQDTEIRAYQMQSLDAGTFNTSGLYGYAMVPDPDSNGLFPYPGACPVVTWNSASGVNTDAVLWILNSSASAAHAPFYAYSATPNSQGVFTQEFSDTSSGPIATKFSVPTIVNGYAYVAGQKAGTQTSCQTGSACYGQIVSWH